MKWSVRTTIAAISLTVICVLLLLFSVYLWLAPGVGVWKGFYDQRVQSGAALLGLFFGAVGTLAGAAASIQIALLGLNVSRAQERFAISQFLDEKFEEVARLSAAVSLAISELVLAGLKLNAELSDVRVADYKSGKTGLPPGMVAEADRFASALGDLGEALRRVAASELTANCFRTQQPAGARPVLPSIVDTQVANGMALSEVWISVDDLIDLTHLLDIARDNFVDTPMDRIMAARLVSRAPDLLFDHPFDHAFVRTLLFTGALILHRLEDREDGLFLAETGLGIVHDLVVRLPVTSVIKANLTAQYPDYSNHVDALMNRFDGRNLLSRHIPDGFDAIDKMGLPYVFTKGRLK